MLIVHRSSCPALSKLCLACLTPLQNINTQTVASRPKTAINHPTKKEILMKKLLLLSALLCMSLSSTCADDSDYEDTLTEFSGLPEQAQIAGEKFTDRFFHQKNSGLVKKTNTANRRPLGLMQNKRSYQKPQSRSQHHASSEAISTVPVNSPDHTFPKQTSCIIALEQWNRAPYQNHDDVRPISTPSAHYSQQNLEMASIAGNGTLILAATAFAGLKRLYDFFRN